MSYISQKNTEMHMNMFFIFILLFVLVWSREQVPPIPKDLILDTDLDVEDVLGLLYILKQNRTLINLKAITLDSNAWVNPGFGVNMVYDLLYMMGRDDISIGVGGEGGITEDGSILPNVGGYFPIIDQKLSTAGSCRYRQAIPPGKGAGSLDIDTHFGLRRSFLPQGKRQYIPGKQPTAQEVMYKALSTGKCTVLLTGPHTNLALLLMTHPEIKKNIEHVYIMGGGQKGNLFTAFETNKRAEFNIFEDPFASYQVLHSGIPITLVPLETTDQVPVTNELITVLGRRLSNFEANYTYQLLSMFKLIWPNSFSRDFYLWDSFAAGIAISGMLNNHNPQNNEFGDISSVYIDIITSNPPYGGDHDHSNPLFETQRWQRFNLTKNGYLSGHVQTGLRDPFCYVPKGNGTCMDGWTVQTQGKGVHVQLVKSAKVIQSERSGNTLNARFYSSFIEALNSPHQTARVNLQTQFPYLRETQYKPNSTSMGGKPVVYDMDMSPGDFLTLFYLLKVPRTIIELKGITVAANGFADAAAIDIIHDVLHMMGRDDIPVGLGAFFAIGQEYPPENITGDCKYRQAVPRGAAGLLDSDTLYGLGRQLPRSPRRYTGGPQSETPTAIDVLVNAFQKGSKLTILTGGPLTNLAHFLTKHAEFKHLLQEVYVLGGSISERGNVYTIEENKRSEFNMFLDPSAAKLVLGSSLDITLVPLDVTHQVSSIPQFLNLLRHHTTPESQFISRLLQVIQLLKTKKKSYTHADNPLKEVVAAVLLVNSKVSDDVRFKYINLIVERNGDVSTDGWTRVDPIHGTRVRVTEWMDRNEIDFQVATALTEKSGSAVVPSFKFQQELWSKPPQEACKKHQVLC